MKKQFRPLRRRPLFAPIVLFMVGGLLTGVVLLGLIAGWNTTTVIVVRHAEKAAGGGDDPSLSAAGQARATELARMLAGTEPDGVYSSDYRRARETAAPAAGIAGVEVQLYDARDEKALAEMLLREHRSDVVLVVGHSNTVPAIVASLGGDPDMDELPEDSFDQLFIVTIPRLGPTTTLRLRYGD